MGYNAQRGPNVSEFIANLNTIPSAQEIAGQGQEDFNLENELAMFTNTQFFDFDLGQDTDLQPESFDFAKRERVMQPGEFAFPDFNSFAPSDIYNGDVAHPPSGGYAGSISSPTSGLVSPQSGEKRKSEAISDVYTPGFEDSSRVAAEEDKRRRNTAASARFRVKKKQREQALEKASKEMSDKVAALEGKINQLETENKWLKNLVMEKNENKDDIGELWQKHIREMQERKGSERKDGVGTKA